MLTTPDNLLFLHLFDDGLQDKLLHHLSRDGGEADRPVVPRAAWFDGCVTTHTPPLHR